MDEDNWLAKRFDESRAHLGAVAYRMLGSKSEADDAVQEAWLKVVRSEPREVANVHGWLTTVVARVCLDMLRSRRSCREDPLASGADAPGGSDPETDFALADAIGPALLVVLEMLAPAERVAFVLHDMFDLSFDEVAPSWTERPKQRGSSRVAPDAGCAAPRPRGGPRYASRIGDRILGGVARRRLRAARRRAVAGCCRPRR